MVSDTLTRAGIPPKSAPSPEEPRDFVPWTGFPPREISPQENLDEGAPPPPALPLKGKGKERSK